METLITLTDNLFETIYTDKKMRNAVAYAHQCCDSQSNFLHFKAMNYPENYKVTSEQMKAAQEEIQADKKRLIIDYAGKLVLIGMGMQYQPNYEDDVCNHRVRGEFYNKEGRKFFVEFGTSRDYITTRVDHAIDRDLEDQCKKSGDQPYNNYRQLERLSSYPKYTLSNLLYFVNRNFDCDFKEIVIDNYTLRTEDIISHA